MYVKLRLFLLLTTLCAHSFPLYSGDCLDEIKPFFQKDFASGSYKTLEGDFKLAPSEQRNIVLKDFKTQRESGSFAIQINPDHIKRVTEKELAVDFSAISKNDYEQIRNEGLSFIHELAVYTSGAGLWSRGGGAIKALVPFNLSEVLGTEAFLKQSLYGEIFAAKTDKDILRLSGMENSAEEFAQIIKEDAQKKSTELLEKAIYSLHALNPIDLKLVNVAINSLATKTKYIYFDIGTSEQTHAGIYKYLEWFKANYKSKKFHPDQKIDQEIKKALSRYLKEDKKRGENHLFGKQEGFFAIDVAKGEYLPESASIGKGAGTVVEYYQNSGRSHELKSKGVKHLVFENIEVVTDLPPFYQAFRESKKSVGVVVVPQKDNYAGGNPFLIKLEDGSWNVELREASVLPKEYASGNSYFNTNTIMFDLEIPPPQSTAFELKEQNRIARVKLNMGDVTFGNKAVAIGGRVGSQFEMVEYENFKSFKEYGENGSRLISNFQRSWEESLSFGRDPASVKKKK